MSLGLKTTCERCNAALQPTSDDFICGYECTFCNECATALNNICPNCGGELARRPRRQTV